MKFKPISQWTVALLGLFALGLSHIASAKHQTASIKLINCTHSEIVVFRKGSSNRYTLAAGKSFNLQCKTSKMKHKDYCPVRAYIKRIDRYFKRSNTYTEHRGKKGPVNWIDVDQVQHYGAACAIIEKRKGSKGSIVPVFKYYCDRCYQQY